MAILVCEGQCNGGQVQRFDAAVTEAGRSEVASVNGDKASVSNAPPYVLAMAWEFKYTEHTVDSLNGLAKCVKCGKSRRWGNRPSHFEALTLRREQA